MKLNEFSRLNLEGRWRETKFAIEATPAEAHDLWERFHEGLAWEQVMSGHGVTLGHIDNRPIFLSINWVLINGHPIAIYTAESQVVDHLMVEKYIKSNCGRSTDVTNFHQCLHDLKIEFTWAERVRPKTSINFQLLQRAMELHKEAQASEDPDAWDIAGDGFEEYGLTLEADACRARAQSLRNGGHPQPQLQVGGTLVTFGKRRTL